MLTEGEVYEASNNKAFSRGAMLAVSGQNVFDRDYMVDFNTDVYSISARVFSSSGIREYFRTEVVIDPEQNDAIIDYTCTCPAAARFNGLCKHSVAMCLVFIDDPASFDGFAEWQKTIGAPAPQVHTTPELKQFLNAGTGDAESNTQSRGFAIGAALARSGGKSKKISVHKLGEPAPGTVQLKTTFINHYREGLSFTFKIGFDNTFYVVKNVDDMVKHFIKGTYETYGKKLAFTHNMSALNKHSARVVRALIKIYNNIKAAKNRTGRIAYESCLGYKEVPLSGFHAAQILRALEGEPFEYKYIYHQTDDYRYGEKTKTIPAMQIKTHEPLRPPLVISADDQGALTIPCGDTITFVASDHAHFALYELDIYKADAGLMAARDFIEQVYNRTTELNIEPADVPAFCANALALLEGAFDLAAPPELFELVPTKPAFALYLDMVGDTRAAQAITAELTVTYKDKTYTLLSPIQETGKGGEGEGEGGDEYFANRHGDEYFARSANYTSPAGDSAALVPNGDEYFLPEAKIIRPLPANGLVSQMGTNNLVSGQNIRPQHVYSSPSAMPSPAANPSPSPAANPSPSLTAPTFTARYAPMRDGAAEADVISLVQEYFPYDMILYLDDEQEVGELLYAGLERIRRVAEVFTTPAFDRLITDKKPRMQLGLSIAGNLINLDVQSSDLDKDELAALLKSYRRRKKYHRLKSGALLNMQQAQLKELDDMMQDLGISPQDIASGTVELPTYQAFYLDAQYADAVRDVSFDEYIKRFAAFKELATPLPQGINATLREYQVDGYKWLRMLESVNFGGILADEMGLGKTLQMITLLASAKARGILGPAQKPAEGGEGEGGDVYFSPEAKNIRPLPANGLVSQKGTNILASGQNIRPQHVYTSPSSPSPAPSPSPSPKPALIVCPASLVYNWVLEFARFAPGLKAVAIDGQKAQRKAIMADNTTDVFICSYDIVRIDAEQIHAQDYSFAVLDEAQYIKNHATKTTRAIKRIRADHRFALTGTPIENRLSEVWSIFDFLMPGFLGGYESFRKRFEADILGGDEQATARLHALVSPFIMRRLKTSVLKDLPDKMDSVVYVALPDAQRKLYDATEQQLRQSITASKKKGHGNFGASGRREKSKIEYLAEITRLRQIALDPNLVFDNFKGRAAKEDAIMELVAQAVDSGRKVLVFSQFTSYLDVLAARLGAEGFDFYTITGATPKKERLARVEAFNQNDVGVFLVSLKAGGTGLNLVGASVVIHADPWWNQAAMNQATDRAHRIGQTRDVDVYKVIAKGTIEERILDLQQKKADLADAIISESEGIALTTLTTNDLLELLGD